MGVGEQFLAPDGAFVKQIRPRQLQGFGSVGTRVELLIAEQGRGQSCDNRDVNPPPEAPLLWHTATETRARPVHFHHPTRRP